MTISPFRSRSTSTERVDELMEEGRPRKEAEQMARRAFGNVALIKERSREEWQWRWLESVLADLKFTFRRLRRGSGVYGHGAVDAGDWDRREYGGVQRGEQCSVAAAGVPRSAAACFASSECSGRAGACGVSQRAAAVGLDVSHLCRRITVCFNPWARGARGLRALPAWPSRSR